MKQKVTSKSYLLLTYFRVWFYLAKLRFIDQIINTRWGGLLLLIGKLIRLIFQVIFLYLLLKQAHHFAGYTFSESLLLLFLLNFSSLFIQMFLRGVYLFYDRVVNGSFDFFLLNPLNELFYSLFSYFDPLDFLMLIPSSLAIYWAWSQTQIPFDISHIFIFFSFLVLSFVFALSWHILVIALGLYLFEVDNLITIYRDLEKMGRFPIEIYSRTWQFILTYLTPAAIMATIPLKVLLGRQPFFSTFLLFLVISSLSLVLALLIWKFALRSYSSASS